MLVDAAGALQPREALESGKAAPEHGTLGELGCSLVSEQAERRVVLPGQAWRTKRRAGQGLCWAARKP
jgi:hypothetical protein